MFQIDPMARTSVYEQIVNQVEKLTAVGVLEAGDQLPSVRSMSVNLSVNPNTVQKAFSDLYGRGIIVSVPGRGSFISNEALKIISEKNRGKISEFRQLAIKLYLAGVSEEELISQVRQAVKGMQQGGDGK
ncbi:MAG: GntR family transcriptional regulator [Lachnospiraceae bacterium]